MGSSALPGSVLLATVVTADEPDALHPVARLVRPAQPESVPLVGPVFFGFGTLVLERHRALALPRVHLQTISAPIEKEGVEVLLRTLDEIFARREAVTGCWDLRTYMLPSPLHKNPRRDGQVSA